MTYSLSVKIYKCKTKSGTVFYTDKDAKSKIGDGFLWSYVVPIGNDVYKFKTEDILTCEEILTLK